MWSLSSSSLISGWQNEGGRLDEMSEHTGRMDTLVM